MLSNQSKSILSFICFETKTLGHEILTIVNFELNANNRELAEFFPVSIFDLLRRIFV